METELSYYDKEYFLKKKREYEDEKSWKIDVFFNGLDVEEKSVLDYGSAAGNMAREAKSKKAARIIAYDPIYDSNPDIINSIKVEGIDYISTNELNNLENKFDLIFCSDVIEHVVPKEINLFITNLLKYAHKDSIICLNSPVKINLAFLLGKPLASSSVGHINVMNVWNVIKLFKKHNFTILQNPIIRGISKKKLLKKVENLPYPINSIWGGHYFLRFKQSSC
jgi:2-polyprenyl-3-methyl-5-hydroxy-6-metoxy-1,4-benzoquinol methylase